MKTWCLGRFDFSLPEAYMPTGRDHSIYHVVVKTIPLNGTTAQERWANRLREIEAADSADQPLRTVEVGAGYPAVFYRGNPSMPHLSTLEAQRAFEDHVLTLRYEGKADKEDTIQRLVEIAAEGYQPGASSGFCVGAGSITSKPSRNEHGLATFHDAEHAITLSLSVQTAGAYPSKHPLEDVEEEAEYLAEEGIRLEALHDEERTVAGLAGREGRVRLDDPDAEPMLRFTWFFAGVQADSFHPEILIKAGGPMAHRDVLEAHWEALLASFQPRTAE